MEFQPSFDKHLRHFPDEKLSLTKCLRYIKCESESESEAKFYCYETMLVLGDFKCYTYKSKCFVYSSNRYLQLATSYSW